LDGLSRCFRRKQSRHQRSLTRIKDSALKSNTPSVNESTSRPFRMSRAGHAGQIDPYGQPPTFYVPCATRRAMRSIFFVPVWLSLPTSRLTACCRSVGPVAFEVREMAVDQVCAGRCFRPEAFGLRSQACLGDLCKCNALRLGPAQVRKTKMPISVLQSR
jgi:hypothetical protein